jgi:hypothetical protein
MLVKKNNDTMQPKDYFKKTFAFVFLFFIVYKSTSQLMIDYSEFNFLFIIKTLVIGAIVATILSGINYFAKVDIPQKKERKSKNNNN